MSATPSALRRHWLEAAWGLFAGVNVGVMVLFPRWETTPFHLAWVSLTLVYGYRVWRGRATIGALALVSLLTGAGLAWAVSRGEEEPEHLLELPLMAAMFLAMVWHARRREAALEQVRLAADRERELVRDVSHGLRTPITVARGHAHLAREASKDEQVREDLDVILEELTRLAQTSDNLVGLAALGPGSMRREPLDVERLVVDAARRWGVAARRRWHVDAGADGSVLGDEERLATALDALLENAVKFTDEQERITVVSWVEEDQVVIEVSDSGAGIPTEDLPHIFERFYRSAAASARGRTGTGLGLAIVKAIAEAHGGGVSVTSEPGAGATFVLRLPVSGATGAAAGVRA